MIRKAEKALRIAVAKTIEEHRRSGDPIVVWENGRVIKIPAAKIPRGGMGYLAVGRKSK